MPQQFNANTFKNVYKDDFADSAGYHRILFNSGRPLQARELTPVADYSANSDHSICE